MEIEDRADYSSPYPYLTSVLYSTKSSSSSRGGSSSSSFSGKDDYGSSSSFTPPEESSSEGDDFPTESAVMMTDNVINSIANNISDDHFFISSTTSSSTTVDGLSPPWDNLSSTTIPPIPGTTPIPLDCSSSLDYNYDPITTVICIALFMFGVYFCIFGYRCYKSVLFLTGFSFGLVIVWLICQVEDLLPQYGNVGIATLAGVLYGLICLLVPYVGFFTLGFHAGLLLGLAAMLFLPTVHSVWISVIFLLGTGLFGAVANVCWPSLSMATTSLIGGAGIAVAFDYFVEKLRMAAWVGQLVKEEQAEFCWFSWLLLALWPLLLVVGFVVQATLTANGFSVHIYGYHENKRAIPRRRLTREERALARQAKYRYLYQVRTAGGDYISQAYIQFLQNKATPLHADTLSTHMSTLQTSSQEDSSAN